MKIRKTIEMIYGESLSIFDNVQSAAKRTCDSFIYYLQINMNGDDFMKPIEIEVVSHHIVSDDKSKFRYLSSKEVDSLCDEISKKHRKIRQINSTSRKK